MNTTTAYYGGKRVPNAFAALDAKNAAGERIRVLETRIERIANKIEMYERLAQVAQDYAGEEYARIDRILINLDDDMSTATLEHAELTDGPQ